LKRPIFLTGPPQSDVLVEPRLPIRFIRLAGNFMLYSIYDDKLKMGTYFFRNKCPSHFTNSVELIKCQATVIMTSFYSFNLLQE